MFNKMSGQFPFDTEFHITAVHPEGIDEAISKIKAAMQHEELYQLFENWCTDGCLRRFLVARNLDVDKTKEMLLSALEWRQMRKPHEISAQEEWVENEGRTGKVYCPGYDKWGRPVVVFDNSVQNTKDPEKQLSYLAFQLEFAVNEMAVSPVKNVEKYVIFMHMYSFSFMNQPSMSVTMETIKMVSTCFPERLGHTVIYKPPRIFKVFFDMVSPFIDERTKSKIRFVNGDTSPGSKNDMELCELIGPNWRELTGAEQPVYEKKSSPGYNHADYWPKFVQREFKQKEAKGEAGIKNPDGPRLTERSQSQSIADLDKAPGSNIPTRQNSSTGFRILSRKNSASRSSEPPKNNPYKARLIAFYQKNNPSKVKDVDKILKQFEGRELLMFEKLHFKYKSIQDEAAEKLKQDVCEAKEKEVSSKHSSNKWINSLVSTWRCWEHLILPIVLGIIIAMICI